MMIELYVFLPKQPNQNRDVPYVKGLESIEMGQETRIRVSDNSWYLNTHFVQFVHAHLNE